jgi:hypothetical protein
MAKPLVHDATLTATLVDIMRWHPTAGELMCDSDGRAFLPITALALRTSEGGLVHLLTLDNLFTLVVNVYGIDGHNKHDLDELRHALWRSYVWSDDRHMDRLVSRVDSWYPSETYGPYADKLTALHVYMSTLLPKQHRTDLCGELDDFDSAYVPSNYCTAECVAKDIALVNGPGTMNGQATCRIALRFSNWHAARAAAARLTHRDPLKLDDDSRFVICALVLPLDGGQSCVEVPSSVVDSLLAVQLPRWKPGSDSKLEYYSVLPGWTTATAVPAIDMSEHWPTFEAAFTEAGQEKDYVVERFAAFEVRLQDVQASYKRTEQGNVPRIAYIDLPTSVFGSAARSRMPVIEKERKAASKQHDKIVADYGDARARVRKLPPPPNATPEEIAEFNALTRGGARQMSLADASPILVPLPRELQLAQQFAAERTQRQARQRTIVELFLRGGKKRARDEQPPQTTDSQKEARTE